MNYTTFEQTDYGFVLLDINKKQSDKNRFRKNKFERFGPYQPLQYIDLPKLKSITIGKNCVVNMNSDFELSNLPNLESVYIGAGSFCDLKSFTLSHNPKLKIFETGDGYEEDDKVKECTFSNVNQFDLSGNYEKLLIY